MDWTSGMQHRSASVLETICSNLILKRSSLIKLNKKQYRCAQSSFALLYYQDSTCQVKKKISVKSSIVWCDYLLIYLIRNIYEYNFRVLNIKVLKMFHKLCRIGAYIKVLQNHEWILSRWIWNIKIQKVENVSKQDRHIKDIIFC